MTGSTPGLPGGIYNGTVEAVMYNSAEQISSSIINGKYSFMVIMNQEEISRLIVVECKKRCMSGLLKENDEKRL